MDDLIEILKCFNRKERFFLIAHALGQSASGEPAFSLSDSFRKDLSIPADACRIFVAMDYHLDWLQAALSWAHSDRNKNHKFCNKGAVIKGTQMDVDLLVAFKASETSHLILVEAKAYSGWDKGQLSKKAIRLGEIFGDDGKTWPDVQPHFYTIGGRQAPPERLDTEPPKWMLEDGKLQWLPLQLPERRKVTRCNKVSGAYQNFRIEDVEAQQTQA